MKQQQQHFLAELEIFRDPNRHKSFILSKSKLNKWTLNLLLCCLTISTAAFQYGYNISSLNVATLPIKAYIRNDSYLFHEFTDRLEKLRSMEIALIENQDVDNDTMLTNSQTYSLIDKYKINFRQLNEVKRASKLVRVRARKENTDAKIRARVDLIWTFINCMFIFGGMLGAFTSKHVLDVVGRNKAFIFHNLFGFCASGIMLVAPMVKSTFFIVFSRFLFGIQSGMGNSIAAIYASEIAPNRLRGSVGVLNQLISTFGVAFAQILGFKELLGNSHYWHIFLGIPLVFVFLGSFLMLFFPESPKALLIRHNDYEGAVKALKFLRHDTDDVSAEIDELCEELAHPAESISVVRLFTTKELRWPLITSLVLVMGIQLSGIKAIFFYSADTFRNAGVSEAYIQYAILSTGIMYAMGTLACIPLVDRLGRRPLLISTVFLMIVNYAIVTVVLNLEKSHSSLCSSYVIVVCLMLYLFLFSFALSPIPLPYAAECFRQNARGTALAVAGVFSWVCGLLVTLLFPLLEQSINEFVFAVFAAFLAIVFFTVLFKVPETKGKNVEEIILSFQK